MVQAASWRARARLWHAVGAGFPGATKLDASIASRKKLGADRYPKLHGTAVPTATAGVRGQHGRLAIGLQPGGQETLLFKRKMPLTQLALERIQGRCGNALQLAAHDGFAATAGLDFWFLHAFTTRE